MGNYTGSSCIIYKTSKMEFQIAVQEKVFDTVDFYREPICLCTRVNVYKYVRIILCGSRCLSFTVSKRMLIFLAKKCYESSQEKLIPINRLT